MIDEAKLVARARGGDAEAFAALVTAHQLLVYNLALRALRDPREAEDTAQEAFIRAWLALPNFRGQCRFSTWLYRIATNLCYNRLPGLRRELVQLGDDMVDGVADEAQINPALRLEADEQQALLRREIEALPESYRLLVTLRYQQAMSYEEIASVLSLPVGTVKTGLFRAKARLRQALRVAEEGEHA